MRFWSISISRPVDRTVQELGDDTDRSSDAGSTSSRTKKRKVISKKKNVLVTEQDSGEDEKPKKKKSKASDRTKTKKEKKKGEMRNISLISCLFSKFSIFISFLFSG